MRMHGVRVPHLWPCKIVWPVFAGLLAAILVDICSGSPVEFWVSPSGSDTNPGTATQPLASVTMALRKARELRRLTNSAVADGVRIILRGGRYELVEPLLVRPEDSGTEAGPAVIEAARGERPVLSGSVAVTGWRKVTKHVAGVHPSARGRLWVADSPRVGGRLVEFRQLWVNGRKATRARRPNGDAMERLLLWNPKHREVRVPAAVLMDVQEEPRLEMVFHQQWEIAICRVKSICVQSGEALLEFHEPEGTIQFEHPWPQPVMSTNGNAPFYLVNALRFLDEPGEWYQDLETGKVYYWPRPGEDMSKAVVLAPVLETLVELRGSLDRPVQHVVFRGVTFSHTAWTRPARAGHVPLQAGMYLLDAYKLVPKGTPEWRSLDNQAWIGRPPAAVHVCCAQHIRFEECVFEHLGFSGLDADRGVEDLTVECCVFRDVGGNGLQIGKFSDPGIETHLPYNPADEREVCKRIRVANNLVTDAANEDWGCVGICVGYARQVTIAHNEVCNTSYTGISVGWGWTRATNCMRDNLVIGNHVHHVATRMCDTAGIYTLSAQPGTRICRNAIHDIHMSPYVFNPEHWFYIYLDEGSSYITVQDNWCPEPRFFSNAVGPGNVWTNNGPTVAGEIRAGAGPEPRARVVLARLTNTD